MNLPKGLTVKDILGFIPDEILKQLAEETQVDKHVKKLTGRSLFNLFLFSFINSDRVSLRVMENYYGKELYGVLSGEGSKKTKHTSLSDRLKTVNPDYFKRIFSYLVDRLNELPGNKESCKITRFDSTLVTLSSKLLKVGIPVSKGPKNQIKFTVAFSDFPKDIKVFEEKSNAGSEEVALKEAIKSCSESKEGVVVFDRGLNSRKTYQEFEEDSIQFVSRLKDNARYRKVKDLSDVKGKVTGSLTLDEDMEVQLASKGTRWLKPSFRLIIATASDGKSKLMFVTNIRSMSAEDITEIYKKRWDIEVFFRFIKQELNAKHFLSRDSNGIAVVIYMIMILATMLLIYKLSNGFSGYKLVKLKFKHELEMEIIKDIVIQCGGDPSRLNNIKQEKHYAKDL